MLVVDRFNSSKLRDKNIIFFLLFFLFEIQWLFGKSGSWFIQENIPLEEVFEHLKCTREGLSHEAFQQRLDLFGYNKLEEIKVSGKEKIRIKETFRPYIFSRFLCFPCYFVLFFPLGLIHCSAFLSRTGKQNTEVFGIYVESSVMGHGSSSCNGYCSCTWRSKSLNHLFGSEMLRKIIFSCFNYLWKIRKKMKYN